MDEGTPLVQRLQELALLYDMLDIDMFFSTVRCRFIDGTKFPNLHATVLSVEDSCPSILCFVVKRNARIRHFAPIQGERSFILCSVIRTISRLVSVRGSVPIRRNNGDHHKWHIGLSRWTEWATGCHLSSSHIVVLPPRHEKAPRLRIFTLLWGPTAMPRAEMNIVARFRIDTAWFMHCDSLPRTAVQRCPEVRQCRERNHGNVVLYFGVRAADPLYPGTAIKDGAGWP